mmetsp:Transcript_49269/g.145489  ORF Transcript_49269/g.145489 Transcript_49269/m.145489 type:complete len:279 (+) Transcript_49269:138-974(+)
MPRGLRRLQSPLLALCRLRRGICHPQRGVRHMRQPLRLPRQLQRARVFARSARARHAASQPPHRAPCHTAAHRALRRTGGCRASHARLRRTRRNLVSLLGRLLVGLLSPARPRPLLEPHKLHVGVGAHPIARGLRPAPRHHDHGLRRAAHLHVELEQRALLLGPLRCVDPCEQRRTILRLELANPRRTLLAHLARVRLGWRPLGQPAHARRGKERRLFTARERRAPAAGRRARPRLGREVVHHDRFGDARKVSHELPRENRSRTPQRNPVHCDVRPLG